MGFVPVGLPNPACPRRGGCSASCLERIRFSGLDVTRKPELGIPPVPEFLQYFTFCRQGKITLRVGSDAGHRCFIRII